MPSPNIICLTNGSFEENCYLVADPETDEVVIVDPGEEPELFLRHIETHKWTPRAIWLTHAHLDHIAGVAHVARETGVEVYLHPDDRKLFDNAQSQAQWLGVQIEQPPAPDHEIVVGASMTIGGFSFEVRYVPGHSPGSVAFVGHGLAIVGDALFAGSVGRVDLPGGDGATLLKSIQEELLTLPDETVVYSGHGPSTTIGHERQTNPFLTGAYPLV